MPGTLTRALPLRGHASPPHPNSGSEAAGLSSWQRTVRVRCAARLSDAGEFLRAKVSERKGEREVYSDKR